jgi:hypothetical protein
MEIPRPALQASLRRALGRSPVTAILGPRQCGKTTLARAAAQAARTAVFFDLESPQDAARMREPMLTLEGLRGLVVLDEIQTHPELFPILRVLADRPRRPARFLILGSASPELTCHVSESLAGRVEHLEIGGFDVGEIGTDRWDTLWMRGGFPRSFLARTRDGSLRWREDFIRTFLERDLPQLGIRVPAAAMRRFWAMLAHYHGQVWNASEMGRALGLSDKTVRHYLDILTGAYVVRQLQPWHANLGKRQIKAPKVYFRDSGLFHSLVSVPDLHSLLAHPKLGASWEGFALEQTLRLIGPSEAYFWGVHGGPELDLLVFERGKAFGFEFKWSQAPVSTRSMHSAFEILGLERLFCVYPGRIRYPMADGLDAWPARELPALVGAVVGRTRAW